MFAQLVPLAGGEPIVLQRDINVVGREQDGCDVVIDNKSVSKMHCVVVKTDGCLFVRDLASTNGTRVNGQRVVRGAILPNDVLQFASEKYRVHLAANPPAGASAAPATGLQGTIQLDFPADILSQEDFDSSPLHSAPVSRDRIPQPESSRAIPAPKAPSSPSIGTASDQFRGKVIIPDGGIDLNQIESLEDLEAQQGEA